MQYNIGGIMNRNQYKQACLNKVVGIHKWEYKAKRLQRSLKYNNDPNANCIHHLQDTEEQIKYNDEHYEYFGFNEDGTFEYGKYVIFVTKEWHDNYHRNSALTKQHISDGCKQVWQRDGYREYMSKVHSDYYKDNPEAIENMKAFAKEYWTNKRRVEASEQRSQYYCDHPETKELISQNRKGKCVGKDHPFYGKHHTDETKNKISISQKANMTDEHRKVISEATKEAMKDPIIRQKIIDANTGENNPNYGKPRDDETRSKISESKKSYMLKLGDLFREYKANGGTLKWSQFQTYARDNHLLDDK